MNKFVKEFSPEPTDIAVCGSMANIATASAVLIANCEKNGIKGYIGSNTFLEMSAAYAWGKPIYLLNSVPKQGNYEEILALEPIVIEGDLAKIATI